MLAIGRRWIVASRKRFGSASQCAGAGGRDRHLAGELVEGDVRIARWTARRPTCHAASGFALCAKIAFEPSPKLVQPRPLRPARHGNGGDRCRRAPPPVRSPSRCDGSSWPCGRLSCWRWSARTRPSAPRAGTRGASCKLDEPAVGGERLGRDQPALHHLRAAAEHEAAPMVVPAGAAAQPEAPAVAAGQRLRAWSGTRRNSWASAGPSCATQSWRDVEVEHHVLQRQVVALAVRPLGAGARDRRRCRCPPDHAAIHSSSGSSASISSRRGMVVELHHGAIGRAVGDDAAVEPVS